MAANPEMEGIVALPGLEAPSSEEPAVPAVRVRRAKPRWLSTALVGGVALIATGSLGYVSYSAAQQRNAAYDAFVGTRATLVATDNTLTLAQADAASKKVTANYAAVYVLDQGKVQLDYQNVQACNSYGACRTAGQDLLNDLQKFQADRSRAIVPSSLSAADASLGDALSAAIAADQEFIDGMDTFSVNKVKDGLHKLDAAMLNLAKAQIALGNGLQ
ncbi:MAG: hypothetical protein E6I72_05225 [Chloroflexi bacterium]|nr:MAG: hypothetical protein E6I72_05225 [Chloroflexota bacterium]